MLKSIATLTQKEIRRLKWLIIGLAFLAILLLTIASVLIPVVLMQQSDPMTWLPNLIIAILTLMMFAGLAVSVLTQSGQQITDGMRKLFTNEMGHLQRSSRRAERLQAMASTLRATLSFERVVEEALEACNLELIDLGVPRQSLVGAVFLFRGSDLAPVATRQFIGSDTERLIPGKSGIVGQVLMEAEPAITNDLRNDPELRTYVAFQSCTTAVCIPLRAGFQIFGAMVIGSGTPVTFTDEHFELFNAVADQAVIALQNAQLYQQLTAEKQRLIEADEEARKELARDLHDGPTQSIAAIAMRINFVRSLLAKDPKQSLQELEKVEELAKRTAKEIRGMLFTLRPLVLETQGLAAAIETVMHRIRETDGLNIRLVGGDYSELLSETAQSVVFSIIEEALGNARKYSKANLIEVRLWKEDNLFVARVQDDGQGFDTEEVNAGYSTRGSLGMVNMRERAERINGSLRVESKPGQGTTVTLVVPLSKYGRTPTNKK